MLNDMMKLFKLLFFGMVFISSGASINAAISGANAATLMRMYKVNSKGAWSYLYAIYDGKKEAALKAFIATPEVVKTLAPKVGTVGATADSEFNRIWNLLFPSGGGGVPEGEVQKKIDAAVADAIKANKDFVSRLEKARQDDAESKENNDTSQKALLHSVLADGAGLDSIKKYSKKPNPETWKKDIGMALKNQGIAG